MPDEIRAISDIIEYAISKEQAAKTLYLHTAEMAQNPSSQQLLSDMATMEGEHEKLLRQLDLSKIRELAPDKTQDLCIAEFLEDVALEPDSDLQTILIYAMKREERSRDFYTTMVYFCEEEDARSLLETLAAQEQAHKAMLEGIYDDEILAED